ncbi:MAG: tRNA uridine-5-carboxymethylaminomethyl(34) synthesis GTPase MnmE [Bacteroidales bacterium]|nr:tRNA uridine-5-carboxymethylaminomethyl(34) synthesis GTPase MnmE [Bacteroidales bacterium]
MQVNIMNEDTICAIATAHGMGAIAVIRISGSHTFPIVAQLFQQNGKAFDMDKMLSHKAYFGQIVDGDEMLDEVLVTFFKGPHSFTGEDSAEISVHGSVFIQQRLLQVLIAKGCRMAEPGEFTRRAFVNRKFDLAQAEAIADLIASQNAAAHRVAMNQMKGGFSNELKMLRDKLLEITALMELELDFSEEDVEFADRSQLNFLLDQAVAHITRLTESFRLGNAIKNGIPVAIVGETNTGKSTLLNALLGEERAIVSDIAGTTRDTIEETLNIDGTLFRFIDTAGLRETDETIEKIGIERSYKKLSEADIVIGMLDATKDYGDMREAARNILEKTDLTQQVLFLLMNKIDQKVTEQISSETLRQAQGAFRGLCGRLRYDLQIEIGRTEIMPISAKQGIGLEELRSKLSTCKSDFDANATLVTNLRHYEALRNALESLKAVRQSLADNIPTDLVAQDLRIALHHLGTITGEVTTDEVLGTIFSRFCIGK